MTRYLITFDRLGRDYHIPPQVITAAGGNELAAAIQGFARRHLGPGAVSVTLQLTGDRGAGLVVAGLVRPAGRFSVAPAPSLPGGAPVTRTRIAGLTAATLPEAAREPRGGAGGGGT
jgi:hypothetical protein